MGVGRKRLSKDLQKRRPTNLWCKEARDAQGKLQNDCHSMMLHGIISNHFRCNNGIVRKEGRSQRAFIFATGTELFTDEVVSCPGPAAKLFNVEGADEVRLAV